MLRSVRCFRVAAGGAPFLFWVPFNIYALSTNRILYRQQIFPFQNAPWGLWVYYVWSNGDLFRPQCSCFLFSDSKKAKVFFIMISCEWYHNHDNNESVWDGPELNSHDHEVMIMTSSLPWYHHNNHDNKRSFWDGLELQRTWHTQRACCLCDHRGSNTVRCSLCDHRDSKRDSPGKYGSPSSALVMMPCSSHHDQHTIIIIAW